MTQVDIIGYDQINGAINLASLFFFILSYFYIFKTWEVQENEKNFFRVKESSRKAR